MALLTRFFRDITALITAGTIVAGLVVSSILGYLDSERKHSDQRVKVLSELSTRRARLEGVVASTFNITQGMVYIISHQKSISADLFNVLCSKAMADSRHIRNIALAPNDVVSMIYPYPGNERAIGLDYRLNKDQWESVRNARLFKKPLLSGPVELVQGGTALIERSPVFIHSDTDSSLVYWGVVSIVAHINTIFEEARLESTDHLDFLIVGKDGKGLHGDAIYGDTAIQQMDPVSLVVNIPGGHWVLMAVPKQGWQKTAFFKSYYFLLGLINTLFITVFLVILIHRNRNIKKKNQELNQTIHDRDKISSALSLSETKYRNLVEAMRDVVVVIDQNGYIRYCSPSIRAFGGYAVEEVEGNFWRNFIIDTFEGYTKQEIAGTILLAKYERVELVFVPKADDPFYVDIAIKNLVADDGSISFHCVLRNINERKLMEVELKKSKEEAEAANRIKSTFLANMSHEVRTPMNAILGFSDILMKSSFDPQESRQYLEVIHNSSQQLLNLINDIIDISLIESGHFKISRNTFPLSRVFHQVMVLHKMSADQKGIDLRLEWGSQGRDEVEVFSDEGRVIQVLNNLVGNAIKFTHEGSVVIGFELNQRNVRFFVRDTGIGIPYDYHDIIFERFRQVDERYSRKYGGTGLGLSICKSIVEKMGGEISVQSEPGKGSCFKFEIPGILAHSV